MNSMTINQYCGAVSRHLQAAKLSEAKARRIIAELFPRTVLTYWSEGHAPRDCAIMISALPIGD